jgi:hypothetical protein
LTGIWEFFFYLLFPIILPGKKSKAPIFPTDPKGIVVDAVCLFLDLDFFTFDLTDYELSSGGDDLSFYYNTLITFSFLWELLLIVLFLSLLWLLWAIAICAMWVALYF